MINGVDSSKGSLILKPFRNKDKNELGAECIKNVIMFSFYATILLRDIEISNIARNVLPLNPKTS